MADENEKNAKDGAGSQASSAAYVDVGDSYRVYPAQRLPALDMGRALAVKATNEKTPDDPFFARVVPLSAAPRFDLLKALKGVADTRLMRPLCWRFLPGQRGEEPRAAIVYEAPVADPVMPAGADEFDPVPPDVLNKNILASLSLTLGLFAQRGLTCRALNPRNLYWENETRSGVMLGDCISHAPAALQPAVFEATEVAMTPPLARGAGSIRDDFYALGTTLLSLATGKMPMAGKPDQQIIMEKVQRGSYSAMMDGERPPFGLRELLRGLLSDNPDDRWGFEELEQWLGGDQRTTVKVSRGGVADRPYEFEGTGYKSCRLLAEAFGENLKKAEKQVYDPEFHSWLQRGFPDGTLAHAVGNALALGFDSTRNDKSAARSVARVCMQLDRFGPIRFQGVAAMPTGLGAVFLDAELRGEEQTAGTVAAAISQGVVNDWFEAQSNSDRVIYDKEIKEFQQISQLLKHKGLGYGIERCLYMLNPSIPCLSPMLGDVIVGQVSELLPELERQIDHSGSFDALVDSHLAAFIASRIKGNIDRQLMFLEAADDDPLKVRQGMLAILAKVQDKHGPDELPALSQWFAAELDPLIDGFHAQSTREKLRRKVRALGAQGDLVALNECFDNEAGRKEDDQGRQRAAHEFAAASREISKLESREFQESAQRLGWKIAVGISNTILTATGAVLIFVSY